MMNKLSLLASFITIFLASFARAFSFSEGLETLEGHNPELWNAGTKEAVGNFFVAVDDGNIPNLEKTIFEKNTAAFSFNGRELKGQAIIDKFHEAAVASGDKYEKQITKVKCFKNDKQEIQVDVEGLVLKNGGAGKPYKATLIIKENKVESLKSIMQT